MIDLTYAELDTILSAIEELEKQDQIAYELWEEERED